MAAFDPTGPPIETISMDETAQRPQIRVGSVYRLIREGVLPATQEMPSAPWQDSVAALSTDVVRIGAQSVVERRPRNFAFLQDEKTLSRV